MQFTSYGLSSLGTTLLLTLGGCGSIVESSQNSSNTSGVAYMLPKALLPVEVTENSGAIEISVKAPIITGDPKQRLILQRNGNAFSSDNVKVELDENTNLLKSLKVESTDQTVSTLVKLVSSMKPEAGAPPSNVILIYRGMLDPESGTDTTNKAINYAVSTYLNARLTDACIDEKTVQCSAISQLISKTNKLAISLSPEIKQTSTTPSNPVDCSPGLCYRVNQPYVLNLLGPDGVSDSVIATLPNGSPTYVLPVERWAFVKSTHDIKLKDGVLQSVDTNRPSSALEVASAPLQITKAVFGTIGDLIQLKIDLSGKEKALADAKVKEIEAKSLLDQAIINKNAGRAESALFGQAPDSNTIAFIRIGTPIAQNALPGSNGTVGNTQNQGGSNIKTRPSNDGTSSGQQPGR